MVVVYGGHAEEHEDDRLAGSAQHLHGVLERRLRLGADVALHVVLHRDAAKCDPEKDKKKIILREAFSFEVILF